MIAEIRHIADFVGNLESDAKASFQRLIDAHPASVSESDRATYVAAYMSGALVVVAQELRCFADRVAVAA